MRYSRGCAIQAATTSQFFAMKFQIGLRSMMKVFTADGKSACEVKFKPAIEIPMPTGAMMPQLDECWRNLVAYKEELEREKIRDSDLPVLFAREAKRSPASVRGLYLAQSSSAPKHSAIEAQSMLRRLQSLPFAWVSSSGSRRTAATSRPLPCAQISSQNHRVSIYSTS